MKTKETPLSSKELTHLKTTNCIGIEQTHRVFYLDDIKEAVARLKEVVFNGKWDDDEGLWREIDEIMGRFE